MAENSAIEWTDHTWSPWEGCTKVSPGCDHCYAEGMNRWLRKGENWGPGAPRREYSDEHWEKPLRWNAAAKKAGVRVKVFPSVCDPFDNEVNAELRTRFFDLIGRTPYIDWLLLTKRIGNAAKMLPWMPDAGPNTHIASSALWPNVWLGATIVNQEEADRDIPKLLEIPAQVRFLSLEPLLGPVNLSEWFNYPRCPNGFKQGERMDTGYCGRCGGHSTDSIHTQALHWVIVGGESGRNARPAELNWIREIVQQCKAAGVPVLVKQLGQVVLDDGMSSPGQHWPMTTVREPITRRTEDDPGFAITMKHKKGGDWNEWPEDLRVREFPEVA